VRVPGASIHMQVDIGIAAAVIGMACADFQIDGYFVAAVDQVVAVRDVLGKGCAVIRVQRLFARVGDQDQFAGQDIDEFSSLECQCRWLDHAPGGSCVRLTPKSVSPPALPSARLMRAPAAAANGAG
jgi:hypothetical protein